LQEDIDRVERIRILMKKFIHYQKRKPFGSRAQAIVEFAIVLPILLMILVGILEFGRMILIYSAVTNASRNAVRYASAVGLEDTGNFHKDLYCKGIYDTAKSSAFLMRESDLTVTITYVDGSTTNVIGSCTPTQMQNDVETSVPISAGDARVNVTVVAHYRPMVHLIPIPERDFTASSFRTILGIIDVDE
jgi:Flp pilus assembly protein TadG